MAMTPMSIAAGGTLNVPGDERAGESAKTGGARDVAEMVVALGITGAPGALGIAGAAGAGKAREGGRAGAA